MDGTKGLSLISSTDRPTSVIKHSTYVLETWSELTFNQDTLEQEAADRLCRLGLLLVVSVLWLVK